MIFSRTKGWIGVDIGTHSVKLAQVERRGTRVELLEALSVPRQDPWLDESGQTANIPSSLEIQAALSLGTRFQGHDAAVALPMAVCEVRTCNVEGATDSERRAAVLQALDMVDPDSHETREFDHWSVESSSDKGTGADNTIALSLAPSWASRVALDMRESGLTGHVLDGLPLAMARAIKLSMPNVTNPVAVVDWGHKCATLCSVKGGRPLFVRGLRECGFQSLIDSLCKALAVTVDEAQKLLRDHGLPNRTRGSVTDLQSVIEDVSREPLDCFVDELNRTTNYLAHQRRNLAPAKVVLLGGGAAVKNMASYLDERVELPVETWRLDTSPSFGQEDRHVPIEMFGPAIALSSLAWAKQ